MTLARTNAQIVSGAWTLDVGESRGIPKVWLARGLQFSARNGIEVLLSDVPDLIAALSNLSQPQTKFVADTVSTPVVNVPGLGPVPQYQSTNARVHLRYLSRRDPALLSVDPAELTDVLAVLSGAAAFDLSGLNFWDSNGRGSTYAWVTIARNMNTDPRFQGGTTAGWVANSAEVLAFSSAHGGAPDGSQNALSVTRSVAATANAKKTITGLTVGKTYFLTAAFMDADNAGQNAAAVGTQPSNWGSALNPTGPTVPVFPTKSFSAGATSVDLGLTYIVRVTNALAYWSQVCLSELSTYFDGDTVSTDPLIRYGWESPLGISYKQQLRLVG